MSFLPRSQNSLSARGLDGEMKTGAGAKKLDIIYIGPVGMTEQPPLKFSMSHTSRRRA